MPRRSISAATEVISTREGVISPESPMASAPTSPVVVVVMDGVGVAHPSACRGDAVTSASTPTLDALRSARTARTLRAHGRRAAGARGDARVEAIADGAAVLRAKIDMTHPNINLRDPGEVTKLLLDLSSEVQLTHSLDGRLDNELPAGSDHAGVVAWVIDLYLPCFGNDADLLFLDGHAGSEDQCVGASHVELVRVQLEVIVVQVPEDLDGVDRSGLDNEERVDDGLALEGRG